MNIIIRLTSRRIFGSFVASCYFKELLNEKSNLSTPSVQSKLLKSLLASDEARKYSSVTFFRLLLNSRRHKFYFFRQTLGHWKKSAAWKITSVFCRSWKGTRATDFFPTPEISTVREIPASTSTMTFYRPVLRSILTAWRTATEILLTKKTPLERSTRPSTRRIPATFRGLRSSG